MGVSGCGKSTLGALLAESLDCPFLEGDSFHSAEAVEKMRSGCALTDADRWPWLDRLGQASATAILTHGAVVAACSALRRSYRDRLRTAIGIPVRFILLENSRDQLLARLQNRPGHYMPASLLDSQLATLERPLPDEQAMILTTDTPPSQLRDRSLAWLR
ncbi:gluconokinase [Sphingobium sp. BYY-5]|uniref:gluconokinase n=1 Tax=Sphingobium sp. BYY-5 TaxID=2926400 RepID=UPI001FA761DB|nr:gluconokinase [Sphingobium sp. BYY-5]MCI4591772.1 gluconokinase [Sphingobium sp. BYY-5]